MLDAQINLLDSFCETHADAKKRGGAGKLPCAASPMMTHLLSVSSCFRQSASVSRSLDFHRLRIRITRYRAFVERELNLVALVHIHRHASARHQLAEQQFVSQRATDGVLDQALHR